MDWHTRIEPLLQEWTRISMRSSMHGFLHAARQRGLGMPQIAALFRIRGHPGCGVGDIATHLDITNAAASQMLDRLVRLGLVDRREDPADRRGKLLSLTEAGSSMLREGLDARMEWIEELVSRLSDDSAATVAQALAMLIAAAEKIGPPSGCPAHRCPHSGQHKLDHDDSSEEGTPGCSNSPVI